MRALLLQITIAHSLRERVTTRAKAKRWPLATLVREALEIYLALDVADVAPGVLERDVIDAALGVFRALPTEDQLQLLERARARRRGAM